MATVQDFRSENRGGFHGPTVVLLFLVTATVSLPVGFRFYPPDPAVAACKKTDDALKKQGVKKSERLSKPEPKATYPSKLGLLLELLREFQGDHPGLREFQGDHPGFQVNGHSGGCLVWECGVDEPGGEGSVPNMDFILKPQIHIG
ncbi:MAG TPA: hypothetical protein P5330_10200 [Candidatus Competibacteraceae bacterium]|nr:hypothetical protein [Candidatus Competibacteraceae bacterium]